MNRDGHANYIGRLYVRCFSYYFLQKCWPEGCRLGCLHMGTYPIRAGYVPLFQISMVYAL